MILQLDPTIPMSCPKGDGYAFAMIDYSQEHNIYWVIAIDETGEIWTYSSTEVKMQKNITLGRTFNKMEICENEKARWKVHR